MGSQPEDYTSEDVALGFSARLSPFVCVALLPRLCTLIATSEMSLRIPPAGRNRSHSRNNDRQMLAGNLLRTC